MSNWEQKRKEMHRAIVVRSCAVSALSFAIMAMTVLMVVRACRAVEENEYKKHMSIVRELKRQR